jgi:SM-20-related protein
MASKGEISVTLLLNGGHNRTLFFKPDDPALAALLSAMRQKGQATGQSPRLFNMRVDEGRHSFVFASTDLVALLIDPPLMNEAEIRAPALPAQGQPLGEGAIVKSPHALLENFIDPPLLAELLNFVAAREQEFTPSTVSTNDEDYRRSLVLHEFSRFSNLFRDRVRSLTPWLARTLGLGDFPIGDVECQLTAHNDGHYFRLHNDSGSPDTLARAISYVFYFNNEPKRFDGGEFRLYNSRIANGRFECGDPVADIVPKNNSILFFPSHCHHEVLPVRCATKRFADSRFTINGWVRRAQAVPRVA